MTKSTPTRLTDALVAPGAFRLFLALVVVLQHFTDLALGRWAVYVFFMLSGYWIAAMYKGKYQYTKHSYATFLASRFWRLFPVYFTTTLAGGLILRYSSRHWPEFQFVYNPWWIARELAIVSSSDQPLLMWPTWSLDIEMQFYLFAPLLVLWMVRTSTRRVFWCMLACAAACLAFWGGGDLPRYIAPFFAGLFIYRSGWQPGKAAALSSLALLAAVAGLCCAIPATRYLIIFDPGRQDPTAVHYMDMALAMLAIPYVAFTVRRRASRLDTHFGNLAYSVYLSHGCVFLICIYLRGFHSPVRHFIAEQAWLLVPTAAILLYVLVDQPSERLRKRFVNERLMPAPAREDPESPQVLADPSS